MTGGPRVLGPERPHYWLMNRMARATGVDLVAAWNAGLIDSASWSALVTHCRGCAWAQGCQRWLDMPVDETRPLPESCRNRQRLGSIRAGLDAPQGH